MMPSAAIALIALPHQSLSEHFCASVEGGKQAGKYASKSHAHKRHVPKKTSPDETSMHIGRGQASKGLSYVKANDG